MKRAPGRTISYLDGT